MHSALIKQAELLARGSGCAWGRDWREASENNKSQLCTKNREQNMLLQQSESATRPLYETIKFGDWGVPWLLSQPRVRFGVREEESHTGRVYLTRGCMHQQKRCLCVPSPSVHRERRSVVWVQLSL